MGKLAGKCSANVANHELNYHLAGYYFLAEYIYLPCQNKFAKYFPHQTSAVCHVYKQRSI